MCDAVGSPVLTTAGIDGVVAVVAFAARPVTFGLLISSTPLDFLTPTFGKNAFLDKNRGERLTGPLDDIAGNEIDQSETWMGTTS